MKENLAEIIELVRQNDIPVSELDLSARAYNALKLSGITYLSEFVAMDLDDLKKLDLVSSSIAEELYICAREQVYLMRKSRLDIQKEYPLSQSEPDVNFFSFEEKKEEASAPMVEDRIILSPDSETVVSVEKQRELNDDRPIEALGLSVRAYNCLKRAGINTVRELSKMTSDDLAKVKNMGRKTIEEIEGIIVSLIIEAASTDTDNSENSTLSDSPDIRPIQELKLSSVTTNCLLSARIRTVQALLDCPFEALDRIYNLSKRSKEEIAAAVEHYQKVKAGNMTEYSEESVEPESMYSSDDRPIDVLNLSVRSYNCLKRAKIYTVQQLLDISSEELIKVRNLGQKSLTEIELIRQNYVPPFAIKPKTDFSAEELKPLILKAFTKPFKGLSFQEIKDALPSTAEDDVIKQAVGELLSEKTIEYVDYRCYLVYPSFYDYLADYISMLSDRDREILERRYSGDTLEAVAQDLGITRERVRQIQGKHVRRLRMNFTRLHENETFDEDFYETLYTKCDLPESFWSEELGLSQNSINYLSSTFRRGSEKPDSILNDEDIPISLRYRVRNFIDRKKVRIDGMLFPRKRADIEEYALRKYAQDEIVFDRFIELYNGLLEANGVPYDEKIYYTEGNVRSRANKFGDSLLCLWKQGERLRYYDIQSQDYTELIEALNLGSYQNTEVSTRKFMELYPSLMEKYDIRDPYELHNLLKKIAEQYGVDGVQFSRQPMLQFGVFDRAKAIEEAMIMLSPVTQADLAEYLYQEYGYDRATTMMSYLTPLGQYYHNGVYSVDYPHIPSWRLDPLQKALEDSFYYVDEIKKIYTSLFRDADEEEINPRSLKSMGFIVNSNYVIQGFPSAEAYFTYLLTNEEVFDARTYLNRYGSIRLFGQVYYELLKKHQIFQFEKDQIITLKRLERLSITPDLVEDYCFSVQEYVDPDSYFTYESLYQAGFSHKLDELGFSEFFYSYLLGIDERFYSQRAFGTTVLYNGKAAGQFSVADFIVSQLREYDSVDLDDFIQDIKDRYGIVIPNRYEVTNTIKGTELYYDDIMDKVYLDKSLYYADFDE